MTIINQEDLDNWKRRNPDFEKVNSSTLVAMESLQRLDRVKDVKVSTLATVSALKTSEDDWQQTVIDYAHLRKWKVAHFRAARTSRTYINKKGERKNVWVTAVQADGSGFPDLVLCRPPRIIFVELKSDNGELSKAQEEWLQEIANCMGDKGYLGWDVWRPRDWESVQKVLY
jgi:hypothetical protein